MPFKFPSRFTVSTVNRCQQLYLWNTNVIK
jgi:hypothetical protein